MSRLAVFLLLAAACGANEGVPPPAIDGGAELDADTTDASTAAGDALPLGSISFFKTEKCPKGWVPFASGEGRFIVPTLAATLPGTEHGTPLAPGEDRAHGHDVAASITTSSVTYAGIVGGGNGGLAPAGSYGFSTATATATSGLPYVQLLVCFKSAAPVAGDVPVPTGTLLFFRSNCPSGWAQAAATQGRWLVGLPEGAAAGTSFGGEPLAPDEQRGHAHAVAGAVQLGSHGILLASGGLGSGYAGSGSYPYTVTSSESAVDLPYVELLQCRKE